jgi:hypothetical protein
MIADRSFVNGIRIDRWFIGVQGGIVGGQVAGLIGLDGKAEFVSGYGESAADGEEQQQANRH